MVAVEVVRVWVYFEDKVDIICRWLGCGVWEKEGRNTDSWVLGMSNSKDRVVNLCLLIPLLPQEPAQQPLQGSAPGQVHQLLGFSGLHPWLLLSLPGGYALFSR